VTTKETEAVDPSALESAQTTMARASVRIVETETEIRAAHLS